MGKTIKNSGKSQQEFISDALDIIQKKYGQDIHQLITKMLISNPNLRLGPSELCKYVEQQFKKGEILIELGKDITLGEVKEISHARDNFEEKLFMKIKQELHCLQHPKEIISKVCLTCLQNENSIQKFVCQSCMGSHKNHILEDFGQFLQSIQSNHNIEKQYEYLNVCHQIQENNLQKQQFMQCWNNYFKLLLQQIQEQQQTFLNDQLKHFKDRQQKLEQTAKSMEQEKIQTTNPLKQQFDENSNIKQLNDDKIRQLQRILIDRYQEKNNQKPQIKYKQDSKYGNSLIEQLKQKKVEKILQVIQKELQLSHQFSDLESYVVNEKSEEQKVETSSKFVSKIQKFRENQPTDKPEITKKKLIRKN